LLGPGRFKKKNGGKDKKIWRGNKQIKKKKLMAQGVFRITNKKKNAKVAGYNARPQREMGTQGLRVGKKNKEKKKKSEQ